MTPAERILAERQKIESGGKLYVTPFRMSKLMAAASKIIDTMVKADTNICYEECRIILALVEAGLGCINDKEDKST